MQHRCRLGHRYRAWRTRRREAWEAVCDQCGLCCHRKRYRHGRMIIDLGSPCIHLDPQTRRCEVYENRFRVCLDCKKVTWFHAHFSRIMPASCAYVRKYRKLKFLIPTPKVYDPREEVVARRSRNRSLRR